MANGLLGTDAALAVIPAGSGNDFARHLGLDRTDPIAAARLLAEAASEPMDVVRVRTTQGERAFVCVGSAGFDSEVNARANRMRLLGGTPKYVYSVFSTLARFSPGLFRMRVDGEQQDLPAMMIAVGNTSSYGGGMRICPDASLDDGAADVCVIGALPKWEFVRTFPKVFSGRHVTHPGVRILRGSEVEISGDREFQVFADGERVGTLPATFTVSPRALRVVRPKQGG